jgi:hypothetical protein
MRFLGVLLTAGFLLATTIGKSCQNTVGSPRSQTSAIAKNEDTDLLNLVHQAGIVAFYRWDAADETGRGALMCVFKRSEQGSGSEETTKLTIYSPSRTPIYEDTFSTVDRFYPIDALRNDNTQLALEVGYGGSGTYFLQLLDYRDGKVVNMLDPKQSDFNALAEIKPQFRTGTTPAKEPFEIRLTRGVGLASSAEKVTTVYRLVNGKYRPLGRYSQKALDDFAEMQLQK